MLPQIMPLFWSSLFILLFLVFFSLMLMISTLSISLSSLEKNLFYSFKKISF